MEKRILTCIGCPLGCTLTAVPAADGFDISGYTCKRGLEYAQKELTRPERTVTSTVRVTGGTLGMVSVKTSADIPKGKIFDCVKELQAIDVPAPVAIGQVIIENVAGTGISVVATKNVPVR